MKKFALVITMVLFSPLSALAGHEGAPVAEGPVTALDKLTSLKSINGSVVQDRRSVNIQHWKTKNGARVYFVEAHELPMLDLRFIFDAGAARDGQQFGLANTVNNMLDEGTATRDTSAIAAAFEQVGANFSSSSHRDMALAQLRVLSDKAYRDPALDVFADVVAHPQFPEESLVRIRQGSEVGLQQQEQSPAVLASRQFYKLLYGDHPYAEPPTGIKRTLERITQKDLRDFHQKYYVAKNLTVAIVGDLTRAEAEEVAEKATQGLAEGKPAEKLPKVASLKKAIRFHQEFPSTQAHIYIGQPGIRYGDEDFYALDVGNEILGGGGFSSRLMKVLRQEKGMTYGVYSNFTSMRERGPFSISLSTRSDQMGEAINISQKILTDFVMQGPSDQEVNDAKAAIVGSFPLAVASNASIAGYLGMIGFYELPLDYLDLYLQKIQKVGREDIKRAFQKHIDPQKLLIVTVGKRNP
jgi:zinc protease